MSFSRRLERRAAKRAKQRVLVPVLNMPWKRLEIPLSVRDRILTSYGLSVRDLTGTTPMHAVFVVEGLALAFVTGSPHGPRLTLHLLELSGADREVVGAAICQEWETVVSGPEVLSFQELEWRYQEFAGVWS